MRRTYKILEWCLSPQYCNNPTLNITIVPDDLLTPDLQRGYMSGIKGTIKETGSVHDFKQYTFIFDKILFKENTYLGTIITNHVSEIPDKNGVVEFEIPVLPINYFF